MHSKFLPSGANLPPNLFSNKLFFEVSLTFNVVFISGVWQSHFDLYILTYIFFLRLSSITVITKYVIWLRVPDSRSLSFIFFFLAPSLHKCSDPTVRGTHCYSAHVLPLPLACLCLPCLFSLTKFTQVSTCTFVHIHIFYPAKFNWQALRPFFQFNLLK